MPELQDVRSMLARAESAATAGDLASADELLREIARIQEGELGPLHPDLANTLNNRAIIAEQTGRFGDAEAFYRRAVAIAAASLPPDDPMLAASRQNLEDFCRARGLPMGVPGVPVVAPPVVAPLVVVPPVVVAPEPPLPAGRPVPTKSPNSASSTGVMAIGAVVLVMAALFFLWSGSSHEPSAPTQSAAPTQPPTPATEPTKEPVVVHPQPATVAPRANDPVAATSKPAAVRSEGFVTLANVELCRTFSPRGENWKCDPAGDTVAPGQLAMYTRVRSARDAVVIHRWYQGDELRQAVRLQVRASATEGYRTFSRQTVHAGEAWRVEVRSPAGDLLHEKRLTVR